MKKYQKKIKWKNKIYIKRSDVEWYILDNGNFDDLLPIRVIFLNDEVEIIEDKKIEKLENKIDTTFENATYSERMRLTEIINKINEIIDYLNSKGV